MWYTTQHIILIDIYKFDVKDQHRKGTHLTRLHGTDICREYENITPKQL